MIRKLAVAMVLITFSAQIAAAQGCDDPIIKRQTLMKRSGDMAKLGASMNRGETPFDLSKTQEIFAAFAEDAGAMPTLFPDCSKSGNHTSAAGTIWDKPDDFKAAIAKFTSDIKTAQDTTKDPETFKANFIAISRNCSNCHETFRTKMN